MNGMVWVRILAGAVWLNGAVEKLLNPDFPAQFATALRTGAFINMASSLYPRALSREHAFNSREKAPWKEKLRRAFW